MYEVNGFIFESEEEAQKAQKEAAAIRYIKSQTQMDDPDKVLELYNKILIKKMFETPVGISFLVELQEYLRVIPYIKNEDIAGIPIRTRASKLPEKTVVKTKVVKQLKNDGYKGRYQITLFLSIIFAVIIIGMFGISYISGNNVNILNYENQIIDKYENWEMQLKEREAELDRREAELNKGESDGTD